jgi:hypothetical protein
MAIVGTSAPNPLRFGASHETFFSAITRCGACEFCPAPPKATPSETASFAAGSRTGRTMPSMTRAQGHANWIRHPSLCHHWMASTLRALAMLMSIVARLLRFPHPNPTAECDGSQVQTPEANDVLDPSSESSKATAQHRNSGTTTTRAAAGAESLSDISRALMVSSTRSVRPSNHEGGLTSSWFKGAGFSPRSRRRPGPSNQLSTRLVLKLQGGTSLEACAGPRPSPGTRWLLRNRA